MTKWMVCIVACVLVAACTGDDPAPAPDASPGSTPAATPAATAIEPAITAPEDAAAAVATLRRYYEAIDTQRFRDAYVLWSDDGATSGQTFEEFSAGYAQTAHVTIEPGTPSRIEPAAGSRYIDIPVSITATTRTGAVQRFIGSYQLRRSVVDGATQSQRSWRIYSADLVHLDAP
jgi:hypothetical protein